MNKKDLIKKGLMPKNVYDYEIFKDSFEYTVVKKNSLYTIVKNFKGEILVKYHSALEYVS